MEIVQILSAPGSRQDEIDRKVLRVCAGIQEFSREMSDLENMGRGIILKRAVIEYRNHSSRNHHFEVFDCRFSLTTPHSLCFLNGQWDHIVGFEFSLDVGKTEKTLKAEALKLARSSFEERMGKLAQELERQAETFRTQSKNL